MEKNTLCSKVSLQNTLFVTLRHAHLSSVLKTQKPNTLQPSYLYFHEKKHTLQQGFLTKHTVCHSEACPSVIGFENPKNQHFAAFPPVLSWKKTRSAARFPYKTHCHIAHCPPFQKPKKVNLCSIFFAYGSVQKTVVYCFASPPRPTSSDCAA